eukprot:6199677-Pleurochrysis_carterae.AAC.4
MNSIRAESGEAGCTCARVSEVGQTRVHVRLPRPASPDHPTVSSSLQPSTIASLHTIASSLVYHACSSRPVGHVLRRKEQPNKH